MPRSAEARLRDMREAAQRVMEHSRDRDYAQFAGDDWFISAVVQHFAMIGEACLNLPDELLARHPDVPWREMRGMRHVVVHEYFRVDPEILWTTVRQRLPELVTQIDRVLSEEFPEEGTAGNNE